MKPERISLKKRTPHPDPPPEYQGKGYGEYIGIRDPVARKPILVYCVGLVLFKAVE
jgi:hypothetical protein